MKTILSRTFFVLFVLLAVLIAVSNAQKVELTLWPLPHVVVAPLWLLVVALLLLGNLVGFGLGWWASRHARRRAREASREAERLDREVVRLKEQLALARPAPAYSGPAPREQKAIERQSALVAPELLPPTRSRQQ
jgi:uncharacterized integral membrane protein